MSKLCSKIPKKKTKKVYITPKLKKNKKRDEKQLVLGKRKIKPRVRLGEEPSDDPDSRSTSVPNTERKPKCRGRGRGTAAPKNKENFK